MRSAKGSGIPTAQREFGFMTGANHDIGKECLDGSEGEFKQRNVWLGETVVTNDSSTQGNSGESELESDDDSDSGKSWEWNSVWDFGVNPDEHEEIIAALREVPETKFKQWMQQEAKKFGEKVENLHEGSGKKVHRWPIQSDD